MRRLAAVAFVTFLAGSFASACSSGSAAPTPNKPTAPTRTLDTTPTVPLTTTTLEPQIAEFCSVAVRVQKTLVADFFSLLLPNPAPGVAEKTVAEIRTIVDELHRSAPPEISESANALAAEAKTLLDALVATGYDVAKIKDQLGSSKAIPAANEVLSFATTRCGIEATIPTTGG